MNLKTDLELAMENRNSEDVDIYNLETHWLADLLPVMNEHQFKKLKDDIHGLGQRMPIILFEGKIIDGRHRYKACQEIGIEPWVIVAEDDLHPVELVKSLNMHRRHLNASQQAMLAAELMKPYSQLAKERQRAAGGDKKSVRVNLPQPIPNKKNKKASDQIAEEMGVSGKSVRDANLVLKEGTDEQIKEVKKGDVSVSKTAKEIRKQAGDSPEVPVVRKKVVFNKTNEKISWSKWSWNPVVGCRHGCKYCYAEDLAEKLYGHFKPTFFDERLDCPKNTTLPKSMKGQPGGRNVFVCSMADLFGKWVDRKWIAEILETCKKNDQWNYIFLTKNPERYHEFNFPENSWLGFTATDQKMFDAGNDQMKKLKHHTRFISFEPLHENITVKKFNVEWIIIGGRSRNKKLPEFQPQWEWVENLLFKAREQNVKVYFKPNLEVRPNEYPERRNDG